MTALLCCLALASNAPGLVPDGAERIRLIVLTDISGLTPGRAEPDDGQSLIRLMLYSDEFDIEALIATSNLGHGRSVRPDLIRRVVDAYAEARPNLLLHDPGYPAPDVLRARIKAGQPVAGRQVPIEQSIGDDKDTQASDWIIRVTDRPDDRPVWVVIWGGSADLAQALWKVRRTRTLAEMERFVSRLRVHSIGEQDSTASWIKGQFPELFTITQQRAYRGMYRGGDRSLASSEWVQAHIHGHGPLGDLYQDYDGGDIWSAKLGQVRGIKEGDTPSFLSLVPNGLSDPKRPWLGSWGGRFQGVGNRLIDVPDLDLDNRRDPDPRMSSVYRWREAFQADFQARLDWCVQPRAGANHPPIVRIKGARERTAMAGETMVLDASESADTGGDRLSFRWQVYPVEDEPIGRIEIEGRDSAIARVNLPAGLSGRSIPILLTVRDGGNPGLTGYGRVLVTIGRTLESRRIHQ